MAFKKFGDVEYPIPGINTAMEVLRPGARWSATDSSLDGYEDDEGREPPTWQEIEQEILKEVNIYNYYLYERQREEHYPDVKFQLDMLYHDIKNGKLENGLWMKSIEEVKEKYPKPTTPPPY